VLRRGRLGGVLLPKPPSQSSRPWATWKAAAPLSSWHRSRHLRNPQECRCKEPRLTERSNFQHWLPAYGSPPCLISLRPQFPRACLSLREIKHRTRGRVLDARLLAGANLGPQATLSEGISGVPLTVTMAHSVRGLEFREFWWECGRGQRTDNYSSKTAV